LKNIFLFNLKKKSFYPVYNYDNITCNFCINTDLKNVGTVILMYYVILINNIFITWFWYVCKAEKCQICPKTTNRIVQY